MARPGIALRQLIKAFGHHVAAMRGRVHVRHHWGENEVDACRKARGGDNQIIAACVSRRKHHKTYLTCALGELHVPLQLPGILAKILVGAKLL